MNFLSEKISQIIDEASTYSIKDMNSLEAFRIHFLGTKGVVKDTMSLMKDVPVAEKKEAGQQLNAFKQKIESIYQSAKEKFETESAATNRQDLSLPGLVWNVGTRHPLRIVEERIVNIFEKIGFAIAEGPEIEDDWHNFTSLNMPADHTARDMQDTFYIQQNPDWLLRTHTSSTQARVLEQESLPVRVICPGRVYRNETISARAHCFFHQCEGLYIDKNVSFADLKQTLYHFVKEMFGDRVNIRFRPSYFPFTEPSAEMDISCTVCDSKGCSLCKHTGWVEILGCGMVHPNLLRNFGIDPNIYTGFAFGMGVERITQIKYQVNDLRLYSQNDVRFLKEFSGINH